MSLKTAIMIFSDDFWIYHFWAIVWQCTVDRWQETRREREREGDWHAAKAPGRTWTCGAAIHGRRLDPEATRVPQGKSLRIKALPERFSISVSITDFVFCGLTHWCRNYATVLFAEYLLYLNFLVQTQWGSMAFSRCAFIHLFSVLLLIPNHFSCQCYKVSSWPSSLF